MAMKHAPYRSGRANGHHGATGLTCAPASETFKLPARRMLEPISLRFENSREKEAADRRHWRKRPEASLCHRRANSNNRGDPALLNKLPLIFYFYFKISPPRRTNSSRI